MSMLYDIATSIFATYNSVLFDLDATLWDCFDPTGRGIPALELEPPFKLVDDGLVQDVRKNIARLQPNVRDMLDNLDAYGINLGVVSRSAVPDMAEEAQPANMLLKKLDIYKYFNYIVVVKPGIDKADYARPNGKTLLVDDDATQLQAVDTRGLVDVLNRRSFDGWEDLFPNRQRAKSKPTMLQTHHNAPQPTTSSLKFSDIANPYTPKEQAQQNKLKHRLPPGTRVRLVDDLAVILKAIDYLTPGMAHDLVGETASISEVLSFPERDFYILEFDDQSIEDMYGQIPFVLDVFEDDVQLPNTASLKTLADPLTYTTKSDVEDGIGQDRGRMWHTDDHLDINNERDHVWGEPLEPANNYFLDPNVDPTVNDKLRAQHPDKGGMAISSLVFKAIDLPKAEQYPDYLTNTDVSPPDPKTQDERERPDQVRKQLETQYYERGGHQTVDRPETMRPLTPYAALKFSDIASAQPPQPPERYMQLDVNEDQVIDAFVEAGISMREAWMASKFVGATGVIIGEDINKFRVRFDDPERQAFALEHELDYWYKDEVDVLDALASFSAFEQPIEIDLHKPNKIMSHESVEHAFEFAESMKPQSIARHEVRDDYVYIGQPNGN